jgi:hypothetical protein
MTTRKTQMLAFISLFALLLAACSSPTPTSSPLEPTRGLADQPQADNHPPVILGVEEHQDIANGYLWFSYDIHFADRDGDTEAMTYSVSGKISWVLPQPSRLGCSSSYREPAYLPISIVQRRTNKTSNLPPYIE